MTIGPEELTGWFVVEVGVRQAWPFLTFSDPRSGGEARLFVDTKFRLDPGGREFSDGNAERATAALLDLSNRTVTAVERQDDAGLHLRLDGDRVLSVSAASAAFTTGDVWWLAGSRGAART